MYKFITLKNITKNFGNASLSASLKKKAYALPSQKFGEEQFSKTLEDNVIIKSQNKDDPDIFINPKKSNILKYDRYITPTLRTVKQPQTQEEIKNKFHKSSDYKNQFILDINSIDDYFVVGAEIFKNYYKEKCKKGMGLHAALKGFNVIEDSTIIKQNRLLKNEEYGPIKEDLYYEKIGTEKDRFYESRAYINVIDNEKYRHIFVPSYKEKYTNFDAIKSLKPNYIDINNEYSNRNKFNLQLLEKISIAPGFNFKNNFELNANNNILTFDFIQLNNNKLDSYIIELKKIFDMSKSNFSYPDDLNFVYSNDKISTCFKENNYEEYLKFITGENCFKFNEIVKLLFKELDSLDTTTLSKLVLKLFFEINLNIESLWIKFEQIIINRLNHMSIEDICRIYFVSTISSPKYSSQIFRNELKKEISKNRFENYSLSDILNILVGFKFSKDYGFYFDICKTIIQNKETYLNESVSNINKLNSNISINKQLNSKHSRLAAIVYGIAYGKPSVYKNKNYINSKEENINIFMNFHEDLALHIQDMDIKEQFMVLEAMAKIEVEFPDIIINKVEQCYKLKILNNQVSIHHLGCLVKYLNQMRKGKMAGSDNFIYTILKFINSKLENFIINDIDDVFYENSIDYLIEFVYASSARKLDFDVEGNLLQNRTNLQEIQNNLLNLIKKNINKITNYRQLSLIFYHIMFTKNKDIDLINMLLDKCNKINGVLSVRYYSGFKYFDYYLRNSPDLKNIYNYDNLIEFRDRFFYAEQIYNVYKYENYYKNDLRAISVYYSISKRLNYITTFSVCYENLFIIPYVIENRKIAIFIYFNKDYLPNTNKVSPKAMLNYEIMSYNKDWEVLKFTWEEYLKLGPVEIRDKKIFDMIEDLTDKQTNKGIFIRNRKIL